ncbi:MAG: rubrerythrin family protein [Bacillota bacterium]|nr:rubrerythrin family protein [Bacillota bacterium]
MDLKGSRTEKNLYSTFAGESRARNKYGFYAEKARQEGYEYIGSIFDETAGNERAHAREVYNRYLKLNKGTAENLLDAADGEALESTKLYKEYEKTAREEGFDDIANFYKELAEVEENHHDRYMAIRKNLMDGREFKRDKEVKWQCMNCGYIHVGEEAPLVCPLCKYPRSYFQVYPENYK